MHRDQPHGPPSIPPERLLKATLLMALYSVRSERLFCEQLDYNLLFRWFLDIDKLAASFDPTRSPEIKKAQYVYYQQMLLRSKLDRVYEDRLSDQIPEELWTAKSAELQEELRRVRTEMERHEVASQAYETAGLQILELAQTAYSSYVTRNAHEQAVS